MIDSTGAKNALLDPAANEQVPPDYGASELEIIEFLGFKRL